MTWIHYQFVTYQLSSCQISVNVIITQRIKVDEKFIRISSWKSVVPVGLSLLIL